MRHLSMVALVAVAGVLSACSNDNSLELTARAERDPLATQVAILRSTATFEADRLQITLMAAEVDATQAARRQSLIIGTLVELGFPQPDVSRITPLALPTRDFGGATETPDPQTSLAGGVTRSAPTVEATSTLSGPATAEAPPSPTADPNAAALENAVTATGVDSDDCAAGISDRFTPSTQQIYVVMNARRIKVGDVITSRWFQEDVEVVSYDFAPDFAIDGPCVWFFVDQTDFAFNAGSYRIELLINGAQVLPSVRFAVE